MPVNNAVTNGVIKRCKRLNGRHYQTGVIKRPKRVNVVIKLLLITSFTVKQLLITSFTIKLLLITSFMVKQLLITSFEVQALCIRCSKMPSQHDVTPLQQEKTRKQFDSLRTVFMCANHYKSSRIAAVSIQADMQ